MAEVLVGTLAEFADRKVRVKVVEGREIGIFALPDGAFRAYENVCPHAGGPVCQGRLMPRVEERLAPDRSSLGLCFSKEQVNIVCPWHGYEYDVRTGVHQGHGGLRLLSYEVRVDGGRIFLVL
ncbi:MAG TPA: Rieske 2Fe-2S domain-containing protein [Ramlibacter sp.]|nr:Rieske 2Fe-2S domain-containing protein [Ramlibacter sp.]